MFSDLKNRIKCLLLRKQVSIKRGVKFSKTYFEGKNTLFAGVNISNSFIGFGTYIQKYSDIHNCKIGRYCSIADHVHTCIGTHPINFISTYPAFYYDTTNELGYTYHNGNPMYNVNKFPDDKCDYQIKIGNDVWIGSNVMIMSGVTIGDGAIVAAGSVVTKSIPPYQIWGGVPAKLIKLRFDEKTISLLFKIQWWNKSEEWILKNSEYFKKELCFYMLKNIK